MHLKERLLAAGLGLVESDFDSHESDLYVISRPGVYSWLKANFEHYEIIRGFVGAGRFEGKNCLDIPFANGEWWDAKAAIVNPPFAVG